MWKEGKCVEGGSECVEGGSECVCVCVCVCVLFSGQPAQKRYGYIVEWR